MVFSVTRFSKRWGKRPEPPDNREVNMTAKSGCATCSMRAYAERKPNSLLARIWRWHTKWCPGWKAYQKELSQSTDPKAS